MSDMKQVKVDNWGIYFLQRLKHFFNRTDYCDLTLQFQDNAQLKVHRLVLSACTEYFELLERTCEMYEDCLIMPDDLQADVVVPIINFMYTGQLEFKPDLLDKLYQTSQIMNMPVLSKLLLAQKQQSKTHKTIMYNENKRTFSKAFADEPRKMYKTPQKTVNTSPDVISLKKKPATVVKTPVASKPPASKTVTTKMEHPAANAYNRPVIEEKRRPTQEVDPRPTRYEVPEELADNIYSDSFSNISYESKPLMVHPETTKRYGAKKPRFGIFSDASISKYNNDNNTTIDVVQCRKITQKDTIFETDPLTDPLMFDGELQIPVKKDSSQLFDQILEPNEGGGPKITIENKDSTEAANIDHAKIISEVLKKYPHLVKGNKNIKLKILDTKPKIEKKSVEKKPVEKKPQTKKMNHSPMMIKTEKVEEEFCTYESDVIDSKEAARLISLGAENVHGPWICLICGTPGRAIHFTTYNSFRRHLVDIHNEKIIPNICEYCGVKCTKRNHLMHHLLTKHGVAPPPSIKFPKCSICNYVALSEAILMKHKNTHKQDKVLRCNVCFRGFQNGTTLLQHIQTTGHRIKFSSDKKTMLRCVYCLKEFIKENNLYSHLVSRHNDMAKRDGILECSEYSDDEKSQKSDAMADNESAEEDTKEMKFDISQTIIEKPQKQRILNAGYEDVSAKNPTKRASSTINNTFDDTDFMGEEIEVILPDNSRNEEVLTNVEFEQQSQSTENEEYAVNIHPQHIELNPIKSTNVQTPRATMKSRKLSQEMQIVVSSAEELKSLMGVNHSIIFDQEGNSSKTLAVLTTPQCSTISTGAQINMETNNQNQVMILPEQYALNMSEAVATNDPNIVVVYSDELDQSKQYIMDPSYAQGQLITTDGIATHFVPSSAVITQNYTTVPNTVISQEMAVVQATNWEAIEQPAETHGMHIITNEEPQITNDPSVIICNTSANNLADMNNISIMESEQDMANMEIGQSEKNNDGNDSAVLIANNETSIESMDVDVSNEHSGEQECQIVSNENIELSAPASNEEVLVATNPETMQENEESLEDIVESPPNETVSTAANDVVNENTTDRLQEELPNENNEQVIGEVEQVSVETEKQIENLTSEWSGDEDDKDKDEQIESNKAGESETAEIAPAEVEESIENIQDEINKATCDPEVDGENKEEIIKGDENDQPDLQVETEDPVMEVTSNNVPAPETENISSLLNDWNENESQEENGSMEQEQEEENGEPEEGVGAADRSDAATATAAAASAAGEPGAEGAPAPHKPDNIRSLVSDWDEDDEDAKV